MALGLDQFVLPDQEPPLLDVVPFYGSILAVVSYIRLQFGARRLYHSVNELPNIYRNDGWGVWYGGRGGLGGRGVGGDGDGDRGDNAAFPWAIRGGSQESTHGNWTVTVGEEPSITSANRL